METNYTNHIGEDGIGVLLLYDAIGRNDCNWCGISGKEVAEEIQYLQNCCTELHIHINSGGGNIVDGYSIISAILNSNIPVHTYCDGLAASIAGIIYLCGDKRLMMDYGTLMLHNPAGGNNKELLQMIKDTLVTILENNTSINAEALDKLMDEETYFTAKKAKEMGLVDEVIKSDKKIKVDYSNISNMVTMYNSINTNINQMTDNKILALENSVRELQAKLEKAEGEKTELQNKLKEISDAEKAAKEKQVSEMVNAFANAEVIKAEEIDNYKALAHVNFELIKNNLEQIKAAKAKPAESKTKESVRIFNTANVQIGDEKAKWTIRDWEKNDPNGLIKMKNEAPTIYQNLFDAFYKKK
jgi:ATP-dependent protease ClpP protease subunit